ncbi:Uncharacterised protein [Mycobacteroides abscessus subsp. abscessus]|nr:Uncharacterised protein [Mycobacteroides abscessus subsp. abscessus]SIA66780.1 Uncharacterised protein [Mycobacteroides abscessus subsp. abscessus]SIC34895.1 Uncharacterised protein [Mycobacteroides abscessus subsp. abscessus]SKV31517.1 Uncharacterised protein [Mycobacteroides abscessus subsp. abscessus]
MQDANVAALQPQPLPPVEQFEVAAAVMAHEFTRLAIEANITGSGGREVIEEMIDDWCGTPWPLKWPLPKPPIGPVPHPRPNERPVPDPWVTQTGRMIGALVLSDIGSRLGQGDLREAMLAGAIRLSQAATEITIT